MGLLSGLVVDGIINSKGVGMAGKVYCVIMGRFLCTLVFGIKDRIH